METSGVPPSRSTVSRTAVLVLRILTFVFLLIALILIAINKDSDLGVKFSDVYSYRYMISTIVIGFAYNLLQMAFSFFGLVSGNRVITGNGGYLFDFYGDKVISYLLATGCGAGFGASKDLHNATDGYDLSNFFAKSYASASLLLFGFLFTAVASIFSSYALPKKAY
ncbi:hypothetical protein L6164_006396 [Bauhinia variegata]|uniref:Uncharacterized protein n=1 Tax=Bauhinia variegata TaxID=167791 RepID=A0ACB9PZR5_BAUVA|nr:hypothetical protein L6164_006396 [Bauhinia variegata]